MGLLIEKIYIPFFKELFKRLCIICLIVSRMFWPFTGNLVKNATTSPIMQPFKHNLELTVKWLRLQCWYNSNFFYDMLKIICGELIFSESKIEKRFPKETCITFKKIFTVQQNGIFLYITSSVCFKNTLDEPILAQCCISCTGFYMKSKAGLKWINCFNENLPLSNKSTLVLYVCS